MSGHWTEEQLALLKARWAAGCSAAEIARELDCGVSRNAVLGKIHRLVHRGEVKPHTARKQNRNHNVKRSAADRVPPLEIVAQKPPEDLEPAHDADGNLLTIETVSYRQCRWPYGEGDALHFCGHETPVGTSWCPYHETRVWQPGVAAKKRAAAIAKDVNTELARAA